MTILLAFAIVLGSLLLVVGGIGAFVVTACWLVNHWQAKLRYEPYLIEPLADEGLGSRLRDFLKRHGAEFERRGFTLLGDFVLLRKPLSVARVFLAPDGQTLGVVLDYLGVRAIECISLFRNGVYLETSNARRPRQEPREPRLRFVTVATKSVGALADRHEAERTRLLEEHGFDLLRLDATDWPRVLDYGRRLARLDLFSQGVIAEPPPTMGLPGPARDWDGLLRLELPDAIGNAPHGPLQPMALPAISSWLLWAAAVPLLIGAILFALATWSANWPVAEGIVERSRVREDSGRRSGRTYEAEIHYRYVYAGATRASSNWRIGSDSLRHRESEAMQIVAAHPPGTRLAVRVCPLWANWSVIEAGPTWRALEYAFFGATIWVAAGAWWGFQRVWRARRSDPMPDGSPQLVHGSCNTPSTPG